MKLLEIGCLNGKLYVGWLRMMCLLFVVVSFWLFNVVVCFCFGSYIVKLFEMVSVVERSLVVSMKVVFNMLVELGKVVCWVFVFRWIFLGVFFCLV